MDPHDHISILVPFKDAAPWFADCLYSIQNQTLQHWECILVDDGSLDDSMAIAEHFADADDRFRVVSNSGKGIVDALNTALDRSVGTWITRMDADDIMTPNKLGLLWEALGRNEHAVATGKVRYFSPDPVSSGYREYEQWLNDRIDRHDHWKWIYRECVVASANWLSHRSNVVVEKGVYPEDYNLVFHWYCHELEIATTPEVTHLWREHPSRTSRTSEAYQQASFFKLKTERFLELDRDRSRPLFILGKNVKTRALSQTLDLDEENYTILEKDQLHQLKEIPRPQILVAVYPPGRERLRLRSWLEEYNWQLGSDWWWV